MRNNFKCSTPTTGFTSTLSSAGLRWSWATQHSWLASGSPTTQPSSPTLVTYVFKCSWNKDPPIIQNSSLQFFCILALPPCGAWLLETTKWMPFFTNIGMGVTVVLHGLVCYGAGNWYGLSGALLMITNVIFLYTPTGQATIFGISPREGFVTGIAAASFLFAMAVQEMYANPKILHSIIPKIFWSVPMIYTQPPLLQNLQVILKYYTRCSP